MSKSEITAPKDEKDILDFVGLPFPDRPPYYCEDKFKDVYIPCPMFIEVIMPVLNEVPTALLGISHLTNYDLSYVKELWNRKKPDGTPYFEPMTITCPPPVSTTDCITLPPLEEEEEDDDNQDI